jgi:hypothetical protein
MAQLKVKLRTFELCVIADITARSESPMHTGFVIKVTIASLPRKYRWQKEQQEKKRRDYCTPLFLPG